MMPAERHLNAAAWLFLVTALALHVLDEAAHDFLPLYNATVTRFQEALGFGPPTFSFPAWLGGLITGIAVGYLLTPWIARGGQVPRTLAAAFGLLMILNGCLHITVSIARSELMPGVLSSPLLIAIAAWLVWRTRTADWSLKAPTHSSSGAEASGAS